jgi:DNA polymerase III subunit delta'
MTELYPWQSDLWQKLVGMRSRMPHALLLQGRRGTGKLNFAYCLTQSLLCEQVLSGHVACGVCQSCNWLLQNNHPDFRMLEPADAENGADDEPATAAKGTKKSQIAVDQVRELGEFVGLSSHRAGLRIILLHPAETLNTASANALLKMLEEPPAGVLFLLVTHQPQRLLPTIRSRCNVIPMPTPRPPVAEAWLAKEGVADARARLAYAGGAPLLAMQTESGADLRLAELHALLHQGAHMDPFAATALCARDGVAAVVQVLQKWIYDVLSIHLTGQLRYHVAQLEPLQGLAKRVDLNRLLDFQRVLETACRHAQHPLNADLQLESLLIQYTQAFLATSKR